MSKQNNEPKPPAIPSIREDGTVDSNGVDLGQLDGWINSENPCEGDSSTWNESAEDHDLY